MTKLPDLRLMIPGPGQIDDDVIAVMGRPIAAHYGPDFSALYWETIGLMQKVFRTQSDVLFHFCSGQAAIEAGMGSLFAPDESILIVNNGFFGQRMVVLAEALGLHIVQLKANCRTWLWRKWWNSWCRGNRRNMQSKPWSARNRFSRLQYSGKCCRCCRFSPCVRVWHLQLIGNLLWHPAWLGRNARSSGRLTQCCPRFTFST